MVLRRDVTFSSAGSRCAAWHYLPDAEPGHRPRPCVVMAHGFAGTREMRLSAYAERFAAAGLNVLVFDYRGFGDSEGEPRQCLSIPGQLSDYAAALTFARGLDGVDPARLILWGSSFSGGHVVVSAAREPSVAAVIAQCAMMDGRAAFLQGLRHLEPWVAARLLVAALADRAAARVGGRRRLVPVVAGPGRARLLAAPDAEAGVRALAPAGFVNEICAAISLDVPSYRPIRHARRVRCPLLVQICERDTTVPPAAARRLAARVAGPAEVEHYPIGHFDIYQAEPFERAVGDQIAFLRRHVPW